MKVRIHSAEILSELNSLLMCPLQEDVKNDKIESDAKKQISCSNNVVFFLLRIIICVIRAEKKRTKKTPKQIKINK